MQTTYIGQEKVIVRGERYFRYCDRSADAATQAAWADTVLSKPSVTYSNGRNSHEVAGEVLDKAEDDLIEFLLLVVRGEKSCSTEGAEKHGRAGGAIA